MFQKSGKIIENDCRHTIRDIAKAVDISLSLVHFHFEILKLRKISASWIPKNEYEPLSTGSRLDYRSTT